MLLLCFPLSQNQRWQHTRSHNRSNILFNNQEAWVPAPISPLTYLNDSLRFPYLENMSPRLQELCNPLFESNKSLVLEFVVQHNWANQTHLQLSPSKYSPTLSCCLYAPEYVSHACAVLTPSSKMTSPFSYQKHSQTEGLQGTMFFFVLFWHLQFFYALYYVCTKCSGENKFLNQSYKVKLSQHTKPNLVIINNTSFFFLEILFVVHIWPC